MLRPARARWILTRNKKLSACYFQGRQKDGPFFCRPLCSMNPTFHPIPRISTAPSGKISHPSPAPPWTLPPTAESSLAPAREVECFSCRKSTSVPATAVSARCGHCSAYIKLDDVILHSRTHRTKVQTCGSVTVQANADLKGLNIECRDLVLYGRASGDFLCRGVCKSKRTSTSPALSAPAGWWWKKDDGAGHRNHPRGKHLDTGVSGRNAYGG